MHLLTLPEPVNHGPLQIAAGRYLAEDTSGAQLLVIAGAGSMELLGAIPHAMRDLKRKMLHDEAPRRILFMRAGGFGDLILLTPVLREVKRRWPSAHVAVSTMSHYAQVLQLAHSYRSAMPWRGCNKAKTFARRCGADGSIRANFYSFTGT